MKIRCAIFDFDGTLFDSMWIWDTVSQTYIRSLGKEPKPSLREDVRTLSLYQSACYFQKEYDLFLSAEEIMRGINQTIEGFYFHEVMPKPGVMGFLERIKKAEIPMCIATASERSHIEAALRRCGMDHYFDAVFTCGEVGHGKDEPVIFRKAVAYFDAEPSMTLVFEDALHAARTAKQDGFVVVGVFDPSEPAQDEFRKHCDFYLSDFSTEPEGSPLWK